MLLVPCFTGAGHKYYIGGAQIHDVVENYFSVGLDIRFPNK